MEITNIVDFERRAAISYGLTDLLRTGAQLQRLNQTQERLLGKKGGTDLACSL